MNGVHGVHLPRIGLGGEAAVGVVDATVAVAVLAVVVPVGLALPRAGGARREHDLGRLVARAQDPVRLG